MSGEGPGRVVDVLRLPSRALEAPADDESDRVDLLDDPPTPSTHQGERHTTNEPGDDVQTGSLRRETLAPLRRSRAHRSPSPRKTLH